MITHYFKITFRNLWKYKTQSLTGIFSLAFGLVCFVPALYWMRYETSYDGFYPDAEQIYRVYSVDKQSGKVNELVSGILERKLHEQFPAMQASTVFFVEQDHCSSGEVQHIRLRTIFTDSAFLHVFPQVFVSGGAQQTLQVFNSIVLTESVAVGLFGDVEKAIGQTIKSTLFVRFPPYTVTAVVKDPPPNTNVPFDAFVYNEQFALTKSFVERSVEQVWTLATLQMYVKLPPGTDVGELTEQLRNFTSQLGTNTDFELQIMPVGDVRYRLNADVPFTLNFIRLLVVASILLMFSAIFNFLNLYLDLFRQRIRELCLRTVHGASGRQLIQQMMFELACAVFLALLPAFFFVIIARPAFSGLLDIGMGMPQLMSLFAVCGTGVMMLMLFIGFMLFWRLSRLAMRPQPERKITGQSTLRRMAVTLQLAVSIVFIVATLVVVMQMRFVNHKDLGFDSSRVIHVAGISSVPGDKAEALMYEITAMPQIESFTFAYFEPQYNAQISSVPIKVEWPGKQLSENPVFQRIPTDSRFAETFGLKMLMGEWLNELGKNQIVLNEEAVRVMGLNEPVGTIIRMPFNTVMQEYTVVGVVNDFHTSSLRSRILPTIFFTSLYPIDILYIRAGAGQEQETIQRINAVLSGIGDVQLTTLVKLYDRLNYSEQAGLQLFSILAIFCLLISLFGVYAVATASTQRRRKEIAIRKVAGAGAGTIIRLFFREYIVLVILAGAVALPFAYLAMSRWLQGYAYRTNIPWWLPIGVITGVATVVLLTVLGQVLRAANSNPAEVVKSE
ncbi:MAG: ABC transporter permease [Tannerellaceae bacterium]|nr:ABC transporter permease [Tannerellaceae bacterium]